MILKVLEIVIASCVLANRCLFNQRNGVEENIKKELKVKILEKLSTKY